MIDDSISILSFAGGEYYHIQFKSTSTIDSWEMQDNTLPDGMTMSTAGVLSGTPTVASEGSIYKDTVVANVNGGGTETLAITIGVKISDKRAKGAPEWNYSLDSNQVIFPAGETDEETGLPLVKLKQTDDFVLSLGILEGGVLQNIDATTFSFRAKQYEGDSGVDCETGLIRQVGDSLGNARYEVGIAFSDDLFGSFLSDDEQDVDTKVRLVCDLTMEYWQDVGEASPVLNSRTSSPFHVELSRKL